MANIAGWKMVRSESGGEVLPGTMQLDHRGDEWTMVGVSRYPEGSSSGRVLATPACETCPRIEREFFPHVFGLEIARDLPLVQPGA